MKLLEQINTDFMIAYKAKNMDKKNFLGVLKSEVSKESKTPNDDYIVGKIKSMIKNAEATKSLSDLELSILEGYLPSQMGEHELTLIINELITIESLTGPKDMGKVMKHLKSMYNGQYDGKMASKLTKEILV